MTTYQDIAERLQAAQMAIENAQADPEVQAALALFGYDAARLAAGRALYDETAELVRQQSLEYGEQYATTADFHAKWDKAKEVYGRSLQVARIAFKGDTKAQEALKLAGDRKRSFSGWFKQADAFYQNLLAVPNFVAAMSAFGYDEAKLQAEAALVTAANTANNQQQLEIGDAQDATRARDAKLDELEDWVSDFHTIAQVALADRPQLLEKLAFGPVP